jgi:hypothetical protein
MKIKLWVGLTLIFVLGLLAGALSTSLYYKYKIERFSRYRHDAHRHLLINMLARELDLTEKQRAEIGKIFEQYQDKIDDIRSVFLPEVRKLSGQMIEDMMGQLNSDQKKRMELIGKRIKFFGRHKRGKPFMVIPSPSQIFPEIKGRLHLTDRQQAEVNSIIQKAYKDMKKISEKYSDMDPIHRVEMRREMRKFRRSRDYRLSRILSEQQMVLYKEIEEQIRREMRYAPGPMILREGLK